MRTVLFTIFFLFLEPAWAQQHFRVGPWSAGDTRKEILDAKEFGPYQSVEVTGGLETRNARFLGEGATVSFVFDPSDRAEYIQVWVYEGVSLRSAKTAALRVFDHFETEYGGSSIPGIEVDNSTSLDRTSFGVVFDRVLGQAPALGEKWKRERQVAATTILDLVPLRQPEEANLTAQLVHSSRHNTYLVFVFEDLKGAPPRRAESNVSLEKL